MPPRTVFLHIGTPKSGTTYLQTLCTANRARLAEDGVLWPGRDWFDHVRAARDLLQAHPHGHQDADVDGSWDRLVDEVLAWNGRAALISMEWLVSAGPEAVDRALRSLAPAQTRLVLTVRDIGRNVPAQWQEAVRNAQVWRWSDYLDDVTSADAWATAGGKDLWEQHDLAHVLASWLAQVPAERVHAVTVPRGSGPPDLLWHRFAAVLGVDPAGYLPPEGLSNTSLGATSAELMRRLNVVAQERGLDWPAYDEVLKHGLAAEVLSRRATEARLSLPVHHSAWAATQGHRLSAQLAASGVHVTGELDDLLPLQAPTDDGDPDAVEDDAVLDAALAGLVGLASLVHERLVTTRSERDEARAAHAAAVASFDAYRAVSASRRVKRCLVELADQVAWIERAYAAFRAGRRLATAGSRRPLDAGTR